MKTLVRDHRTFGYEVARSTDDDGNEFVLIQTAAHSFGAAPAGRVHQVTEEERDMEITIRLTEVIERARFLGATNEQIAALFERARRTE